MQNINNTEPALQHCAVCSKNVTCPWAEFSNKIKEKYCPLLAYLAQPAQQPQKLGAFLQNHRN